MDSQQDERLDAYLTSTPADTRRESFEKAKLTRETRQEKILEIVRNSPNGATIWDINATSGFLISSIVARLNELEGKGLIHPSGRTRYNEKTGRNCTVWVAT